jgi:hypothetical protein
VQNKKIIALDAFIGNNEMKTINSCPTNLSGSEEGFSL